MKNLTTPKAILIGSGLIAFAILFRIDGIELFVSDVNADVAGMDHRDLRRDRDFKKAVQYIVSNCYVGGERIYC